MGILLHHPRRQQPQNRKPLTKPISNTSVYAYWLSFLLTLKNFKKIPLNKKLHIILFVIIFLGCNKNHNQIGTSKKEINYLFAKAENLKYPKQQRIEFLDKINVALQSKKYDSILKADYFKLASLYYYNDNRKKQLSTYKNIEQRAVISKDSTGIIQSNCSIARFYFVDFSNDSSFYYFSKAEKLSKKTFGNPCITSILQGKADLFWCQKDYAEAEGTAVKALKIASTKKNYEDTMFYSYITIANAEVGMNNNKKALEYYKKALQKTDYIEPDYQKIISKASAHNYIAEVYQKQNRHQKVVTYLEKNINFKEIKKIDLKTYCYIRNTLAYSKFKLNEKSALLIFKEVLHIADSTKFVPTQVEVKTHLGEYYLTQKDTAKANYFLKTSQVLAHKNKIFEDELHIFKLLQKANPDQEAYYSNRYIKLNDSLQNIERATRDKFARIEFETDEVTKQKNKIEEEKSVLLTRLFLISGFGLLSIIIIFLWFKNKSQKAKTRELLLEKEHQKDKEEIYQLMLNQQQKIEEGKQLEKKRISQELHDGVMGKLSSIRMNLFVLNKKSDPETIAQCLEYVKEIQKIEKEIRTISHDLNKNIFSDSVNFVSIVENLFTAIESHTEIDFNLKVDQRIDWETVDNKTKINIYRIIQEALQNIDKYAQAENVFITMNKKESAITIEIKDDGVGFATNNKKNGIGITNMNARMQEIKGQFNIESQPKKGTKINLTIPN